MLKKLILFKKLTLEPCGGDEKFSFLKVSFLKNTGFLKYRFFKVLIFFKTQLFKNIGFLKTVGFFAYITSVKLPEKKSKV